MHLKETDLYAPIKSYFEALGYEVKGEVKGCDVVLIKDEEIAVIELKKTFSIGLLYQIIERQKVAHAVYAAIPRSVFMKKRGQILHITEKLNVGLITVAMDSPVKTVAVHIVPKPAKKRNNARSKAIIAEMNGRSFDANLGGSTRQKLMTAFRERAIRVACVLEQDGPAKPSELIKKYSCDKYVGQMLRRNYYGWFTNIEKGVYSLSEIGVKALEEPQFKQVVEYYQKLVREQAGGNNV